MASLIPGYEYDIFISYRQKDNKGDRWVSEFVEALKTELESTFKEEISVYFDINPHDGLLETHDVDASLKEKLKCLVFIPIISRTYCDPKSFAWEHEFKTFVEQASQDQFGLKVRLPSGNVANRVLPIRIHDLDTEDIKLCESILGGVLRGIEFIYKESGIDKPLAPEDNEKKNLNNTKYRIQIIKVAHAIKEIISGLKTEPAAIVEEKSLYKGPKAEIIKEDEGKELIKAKILNQKSKKRLIILMSIFLCVIGAFVIFKIVDSRINLEKSIAVLPFENLSSDEDKVWFNEGITDVIINQLSKISDLRVLGRTSTLKYREEQKSISEIGKELKVNYIIEGTVQRQESNLRISVQLIRVINESHVWSDIYDREWKDIFDVQSDIAQRISEELKSVLTPEEKELIEKSQTKNPEAYNLYLQGRFFWNKRTEEGLKKSVEYFEKSVAEDPDYALAYAGLADAYQIQAWWGWAPMQEGFAKAKEMALRALEIDKKLAEVHATLGSLLCYSEWNWEEARKELLYAIELNPNYIIAHSYYSELLDILGQDKEARFQINLALGLDPFFPLMHAISSVYFYHEGKFRESMDECRKTQELDPDYVDIYWRCFKIYVRTGEDLKAVEELQRIMQKNTLTAKNASVVKEVYNKSGIKGLLNWLIELELKHSEPNLFNIAEWYAIMSKKDEALNWLEKAFEKRPPDIPRINNDRTFNDLRSEPRFKEMIKKMGLSEYAKKE